MPVIYSRDLGSSDKCSEKTLWVDEYLALRDQGLLSPVTESLGFKTYYKSGTEAPIFTTEEEYLAKFRLSSARSLEKIKAKELATAIIENSTMSTSRRPSLLINGLPSVQEDGAVPPPTASASSATPQRDAARLNMLRRMRPPPFQYAWTFYHDKHSDASNYEGRLTTLLENIITLKPFWEMYNRFPLDALKMKDSVHFFKRGVKPVWEDPRNVHGGAWTFRVPKDKSEQTWKEILLLTVGEQFADVIQPKDDLCGVSLSIRFNSNLIMIWNRDGTAQKTIDGILAVVMEKITPVIKPKEGSYYYKKHSEHAGFSEVVSKAAEAAITSGKIEEAKVKQEEAEMALIREEEEEAETARKRSQTA